jgi:hypothetical protein
MFNYIVMKYSRPGITPSQVKLFRTYFISPKTLCFKQSQNIYKHDAEDVFYWLSSCDQNLKLQHPTETDKQRSVEGTEEADFAERMKRVKKVSTLCVGLGLTATGVRMLEDIVSYEQQIARPRQRDKRTTAD